MDNGTERGSHRKRFFPYAAAIMAVCVFLAAAAACKTDNGGKKEIGKLPEGKMAKEQPPEDIETEGGLKSAGSYEEIYQYFREQVQAGQTTASPYMMREAKQDAAGAEMAVAEDRMSYSDTNVRADGVGEGDIVKTDGNYLYILKDGRQSVVIVDVSGEEMTEAAQVKAGEMNWISELYVQDTSLILLGTRNDSETGISTAISQIYDISNPEKPVQKAENEQSGAYGSSRLVGDDLYVFSKYYVYSPKKDDISGYVPLVGGKAVPESRIFLPGFDNANMYTVISSVNLHNPSEIVDETAVLADAGEYYVSRDNIYLYETRYSDAAYSEITDIRKLAFQDGKLDAKAKCKVNGRLNDSFCLDEYEGNLRLVVTVSKREKGLEDGIAPQRVDEKMLVQPTDGQNTSNALYVLDESLKLKGKIEGLAIGEQIYSARFMGETGYFVTFRQIDPLFSVDLSNPEKPEILGQLKIPGFSEYLHVYGEGKLLGVGMDVEENADTSNGVKLSMFDISNPSDVKEVQKTVIERAYSADIFYNYKAAFIDEKRNKIGFGVSGDQNRYLIFSYDQEDGFTREFEREMGNSYYEGVRGICIGGHFYLVTGNTVEMFDMNGYEKIDDMVLS